MKYSPTGQENGDLLIQVTAWPDLTVFEIKKIQKKEKTAPYE